VERLPAISPADLDAFLITAKWFKTGLQHFKGIPGDVEAASEIAITFFDSSPCLILGAGQPIKARLSADRRDLFPHGIPFLSRPETKIEHHVEIEFKTSQPDILHLFPDSSIEFREVLDRRIVAVKACHPFVVREADCRQPLLKLSSECGLPTPRKP